jgi:HSP20 family protein
MNYPLWRGGQGRGWDPFGELHALRAELSRVGSALVGRAGGPDVDLEQTDDGWTVIARLPGVAPEEVAVEIEGRELCIRARSEAEVNADQGSPGTGSRTRSFEYRLSVPSDVDVEHVDAVMDHGLLTVTLPRASRVARRTITVGSRQYGGGRTVEGTATEGGHPASGTDPAADREMHRPDVTATEADRQPFG